MKITLILLILITMTVLIIIIKKNSSELIFAGHRGSTKIKDKKKKT